MNVKTDTKEKFHAITVPGPSLSATMTDDLANCLLPFLQKEVKNLILILKEVGSMDVAVGKRLVEIQQAFYDNSASFVICEMQKPVEKFLSQNDILEQMNFTPTESEAWDIVQMEELEREFLKEGPLSSDDEA